VRGRLIPARATGVLDPGDTFEGAVIAINRPLSACPANFLRFREAKVEFYR
jgi:hypothetical protein